MQNKYSKAFSYFTFYFHVIKNNVVILTLPKAELMYLIYVPVNIIGNDIEMIKNENVL